MDDFGQISAEALVLLAAVLAVAFVLVSQLVSTSQDYKKSSTQSQLKIDKTLKKIKGGK